MRRMFRHWRKMTGRAGLLVAALLVVTGLIATAAFAGGGKGSRAHPYPLHTTVLLPGGDGWKLRVNKTVPNGTAAVMAENQFNDPPKAGRQFFLINVTETYAGKASHDAYLSVNLSAVGRSNVAYTQYDDHCGVIPNPLDELKTVFTGGSLTGNICMAVKTSDVPSLQLFHEATFSGQQVFFALR